MIVYNGQEFKSAITSLINSDSFSLAQFAAAEEFYILLESLGAIVLEFETKGQSFIKLSKDSVIIYIYKNGIREEWLDQAGLQCNIEFSIYEVRDAIKFQAGTLQLLGY